MNILNIQNSIYVLYIPLISSSSYVQFVSSDLYKQLHAHLG